MFKFALLVAGYARLVLFVVLLGFGIALFGAQYYLPLSECVEYFFLLFICSSAIYFFSGVLVKCPNCGCLMMFRADYDDGDKQGFIKKSKEVFSVVFLGFEKCPKCGTKHRIS